MQRWRPAYKDLWSLFDVPAKQARLNELRASLENPDLWSNPKKLTEVNKQISALSNLIEPLVYLSDQIFYLREVCELGDPALLEQAELEAQQLEAPFSKAMALTFGPDDHKAAYLMIQAGSGGREACSWAEMLLRMYSKHCAKLGLTAEFIDFVPNEPDGIKTVTIRVEGERAYGRLKDEAGVHRLSRVSPFDQADRRQTSFAAVEITAEAERTEVDIMLEKDLDVTTCCGGGPGGQNVNKRETTVVIKHLPTGIQVRCQNERTQETNKAVALELLRAKLMKRKRLEEEAEANRLKKAAPKAAFGNEYRRTYVLSQHPGVHDHLTDKSTTQVQDVLNGHLEELV